MQRGVTRWLAVAIAVLGLLVVAIVARSTPSHPFTRTAGHAGEGAQRTIVPPTGAQAKSSFASPLPTSTAPGGIGWATPLLAVLLLVLIVLTLAQWLAGHRLPRRGRRLRLRATAPGVPDPRDDEAAAQELVEAVDEGLIAIERGPVSDAIIACWVRVETAAEEAGTSLRASETSSEFVDRVLGEHGAREDALRRMSMLYREARFSGHAMGERSRAEARACLAEIAQDLAARQAASEVPGAVSGGPRAEPVPSPDVRP